MIISLLGASCHGALVRGDFCPVPIITPKKIHLNTMKKGKETNVLPVVHQH